MPQAFRHRILFAQVQHLGALGRYATEKARDQALADLARNANHFFRTRNIAYRYRASLTDATESS